MPERINEINELRLISKKNDQRIIELLFELLSTQLFGSIISAIKDESTAKDIVQETFSCLIQRGFHGLDDYKAIEQFILNTKDSLLQQHFENNNLNAKEISELLYISDSSNATVEDDRIKEEVQAALARVLSKLPHLKREIFTRLSEGATSQEVANILQLKKKEVDSINYITLQLLKSEANKILS